jgi:hypothetical protein
MEKHHYNLIDRLFTSALQKNPGAESAWVNASTSAVTDDVKTRAAKKGLEIIAESIEDFGTCAMVTLKRRRLVF